MKNARFDFSLALLTVTQTLGAAPLLVGKWRRFRRRRASYPYDLARYGYEWDMSRWHGPFLQEPSAEWHRKQGPHLTFCVDGYAETRLAVNLARILEAQRPQWRFSLTIRNLRDAKAGHAIPSNMPYSALPFDYFPAVKRWFSQVQPDGVVLVEKMFYPNFVRGSAVLGARVQGINSYTRASDCRKNPRFKSWILRGFSGIGLRSKEQDELLRPLVGDDKRRITGSLKFPPPKSRTASENESLQKWVELAQSKPLIGVGSSEPGEVEVLCEALSLLKAKQDVVLLWAPRLIATAKEVARTLEERGWTVSLRSESATVSAASSSHPDVLLLDTMGELASAYAYCEGAFVGGTFAGGGHNVLEPIAMGIPVVFGPGRGFFAAEQTLCEENGVGVGVQNAQELADVWEKMLRDEAFRAEVRERIGAFLLNGQKNWEMTVQMLLEEFDSLPERR